jgi:nitrate reductase NapAB chaperone NapD
MNFYNYNSIISSNRPIQIASLIYQVDEEKFKLLSKQLQEISSYQLPEESLIVIPLPTKKIEVEINKSNYNLIFERRFEDEDECFSIFIKVHFLEDEIEYSLILMESRINENSEVATSELKFTSLEKLIRLINSLKEEIIIRKG